MTPGAVLEAVAAVGGEIFEEAGRLIYRAPRGALEPATRAAIRHNRNGIIEELRRGWAPPPLTPVALARSSRPPSPPLASVLAAPLVRCADCRHVHYRSSPPPRTADRGTPWTERLECAHGLDVTLRELEEPRRYCTKFNRRLPRR